MIMFGKAMITNLSLPFCKGHPLKVSKLTLLLKENSVCISSVTMERVLAAEKKFHPIE